MIAQSYDNLSSSVKEGSEVLIDDGLVALIVERVDGDHVVCRVKNGGLLGETKGVNLPGAVVELPALTEKDKGDLTFGCAQKVDLVAASFIRKASDVIQIREHLTANGGSAIKIISKIENQEGLQNFDDILAVSDGIMVARGDLGVEIPIEKVAIAQKMMISKCNVAGKPVVTAVCYVPPLLSMFSIAFRFFRPRPGVGCARAWPAVKWAICVRPMLTRSHFFIQVRLEWMPVVSFPLIAAFTRPRDLLSVRVHLRNTLV